MYDNHAIMLTANVNINMKETVLLFTCVKGPKSYRFLNMARKES